MLAHCQACGTALYGPGKRVSQGGDPLKHREGDGAAVLVSWVATHRCDVFTLEAGGGKEMAPASSFIPGGVPQEFLSLWDMF